VIARPSEHTDHLVTYLLKAVPASLEAKSFTGHTPLHLAFKLGRLSIAKILIAAGANQATRDSQANNLIHSALTHLPADLKDRNVEPLGEMLELLDPKLRYDMLLQRNSSVAMTGATPLHSFIQRRYTYFDNYDARGKKQNVAVMMSLLKYSNGDELGIINGSGDLPLHTLITARSSTMVKALLDFNSKLVCVENVVGRTPAEIAKDQFLAQKLSAPPTLWPSWARSEESEGLVDRNPNFFVPGYKKDKRDEVEKMWNLVERYVRKNASHSVKRKLVSLNEANEVAKRLGEMSKKRKSNRYHRYQNDVDEAAESDDDEKRDEVGDWYNNASPWKEYGDVDENREDSENQDNDHEEQEDSEMTGM
jgi:hypothetical protein